MELTIRVGHCTSTHSITCTEEDIDLEIGDYEFSAGWISRRCELDESTNYNMVEIVCSDGINRRAGSWYSTRGSKILEMSDELRTILRTVEIKNELND